jgi:hypothetical protein
MRPRFVRGSAGFALVMTIAVLSACHGGGTPAGPAPILSGSSTASYPQGALLQFTIGSARTTSSNRRSPQYISPSILSAVATVYQQSGGVGPYSVQAAQLLIDLSSSSPNCQNNQPVSGERTCSIYMPAPVGSDVFQLDTYDALVANLHNSGIHELSTALSAPVTVTPGSSVSVTLALQGIIAGFTVPGSTAFQFGFLGTPTPSPSPSPSPTPSPTPSPSPTPTPAGPQTVVITATGAGTFTIPSNWIPGVVSVQVIGGGGGGGTGTGQVGADDAGGGGGGGGYAATNFSLTPGSMLSYSVGSAGTPGVAGGDSWFCNSTSSCSSSSDSNVVLAAHGGGAGASLLTGGSGGTAPTGGTTYTGGTGGTGTHFDNVSSGGGGGGGGGAAGPHGAGGAGGNSATGGGCFAGVGGSGGQGDNGNGGLGGTGSSGCGGESAGNPGTEIYNSTYGSGGGGGGGEISGGDNGGNYGAGGGGGFGQGGNGGSGAGGLIIITYSPGT